MASTQQLKRRMGSIKNTKQITKAMELVSASKMRRAQEAANKSRDFRNVAREILTRLRQLTNVNDHPLFKQRKVKTRLHIVIASDRTLAGAYNSNVLKQFAQELQQDEAEGVTSQAIVIGRQVARFVSKVQGCDVVAVYENFPEHPDANDIRPLLNTVVDKFLDETIDAVDIIYTDYKSSIRQEVTSLRLLPAAFQEIEIEHDLEEAIFEPSVQAVLDNVTLRLVESLLSQSILESFASEHSMRMMAMKNASDNATELIDDLTLAFNTARQASITQEIAEITGGAEAIS
ncbi:MAG: synthase gamma chain [Patescibacteria group bacterium]|nr:synthase gamma chain [Patescibacteria group bacterium]